MVYNNNNNNCNNNNNNVCIYCAIKNKNLVQKKYNDVKFE